MRSKAAAVSVVAVALFLTNCGGEQQTAKPGDSTATPPTPTSTAPTSAAPTFTASSTSPSGSARDAGSLVASGFGQKDQYAWVTALVHNNSDKVGQTVTVQFNAKDPAGTLVKSTSQVESFSRLGQDLAVGTQVTVPNGSKIATVEATLLVGSSDLTSKPFPDLGTTPVKLVADQYGGLTADFELSNPTNMPLKDPRLGIICYDAANKIIGGGSSYPDLVPSSGKVAVEGSIITTGKPVSCKVYPGAPA